MKHLIQIDNRLPESLTCQGVRYPQTKDLSMKELVLFLERDLFQLKKRFSEHRPEFFPSLIQQQGHKQIRVEISANNCDIADRLCNEVEAILWSYNQQTMLASNGSLHPSHSRFTYRLAFSISDDSRNEFIANAGG
ncbi:MAG: hypothetical protein HYW48_12045 [Deltaproteobacteria bacterium]|nr:hypothetical protein [Deltaproteobacteria bacterium]